LEQKNTKNKKETEKYLFLICAEQPLVFKKLNMGTAG